MAEAWLKNCFDRLCDAFFASILESDSRLGEYTRAFGAPDPLTEAETMVNYRLTRMLEDAGLSAKYFEWRRMILTDACAAHPGTDSFFALTWAQIEPEVRRYQERQARNRLQRLTDEMQEGGADS